MSPKANGEPVQPASFRYQTAHGETYSLTRISWLASEFALQCEDGTWLICSNGVAWFDSEQNRDTTRLEVPPGTYQAVRFLVGLGTNLNHVDVAQIPAGAALNPNVNGLHWSWQGGFIFLALEGLWRNGNGEMDGWAYHLARDTNAVPITLAAPLVINHETRLALDLDVTTALNAPQAISFAQDGSSTHSRDGDPLAARLRGNLPGAFRVHAVTELNEAEIAQAHPRPKYLPEHYTPFEFKLGATFPIPELPRDNPLLVERVDLGRTLFFDRQLAINGAQACADCHTPAKAFTDGRRVSRGAEGETGERNAMPLFNLAWKSAFFWDGRAPTLREQVLQPIQNPIEMHESLTNLVHKLTRDKSYAPRFAAAFGSPEITSEKLALALENYLLTLTTYDAKFDRVMRGEAAFTSEEQRGFALFSTEYDPRRGQYGADCFHCHGGPLFQSQAFANNGLDEKPADPGRGKITGKPGDLGKFATPSLRNVALTAPYMHEGRFRTLAEVVTHYATGVKRSATLDPNLAKHPDGGVPLTADDQKALVAFLETLTDASFLSSAK